MSITGLLRFCAQEAKKEACGVNFFKKRLEPHRLVCRCVGTVVFSLKERGVSLGQVDKGKEKMELPPRLGLRTINIALLRGITGFTAREWVWSLGMEMERC